MMLGRRFPALLMAILVLIVCLAGCTGDDGGNNESPQCSIVAVPSSGYAPLMVNFTLEAEDMDGDIAFWGLDTDDGSDVQEGMDDPPGTVLHTFVLAGEYQISFSVVDDDGAEGVDVVTVTVEEELGENQPPTSMLTVDVKQGETPLEVTFNLTGSDPDGTIVSWELDVDGDGLPEYDGSGSTPPTRAHTYEDIGTHLITLKVEDDRGSTSRSTAVVVSGVEGGSRDWPAHIGTTVAHQEDDDYLYGDHTVNATVRMVIRGEDAWDLIEDANMFNDPPHEGYEYILALIDFGFENSSVADIQYDISSWDFTAVSSLGVDQEVPFVVEPDPPLSGELYAGASLQGWAAYEVPNDDTYPLLTFGRDLDGLGGMWFELFEQEDGNERPFAAMKMEARSGEGPIDATILMGAMDPDGNISSWELDIDGDGLAERNGTGMPKMVELTLSESGSYTVRLVVTDDAGSTDTALGFISVYDEDGPGHSRSDAVPVGSSVVFEDDDYFLGEYMINMTVVEIIRGEDAWTLIDAANMFNDEPEEGHEYILVLINVAFLGSEYPEIRFDISTYSFEVISEGGSDYDVPFIVEPWPSFDVEMYAGASFSGWAAFEVEMGDDRPLLSYGTDYLGRGGMWFQLYGSPLHF
jgi:PKD repeat protein